MNGIKAFQNKVLLHLAGLSGAVLLLGLALCCAACKDGQAQAKTKRPAAVAAAAEPAADPASNVPQADLSIKRRGQNRQAQGPNWNKTSIQAEP